ncbi:MAG: hypothetical protein ACK5LT_06495 [Lachnospirales bacterium]
MDYSLIVTFCTVTAIFLMAIIYQQNNKRLPKILFTLVLEAESYLGSGTGKAKLAFVVSLFYERYPKLGFFVSEKKLIELIELAVIEMADYIESNKKIKELVELANE